MTLRNLPPVGSHKTAIYYAPHQVTVGVSNIYKNSLLLKQNYNVNKLNLKNTFSSYIINK